jgi:hypothetical protein
MRSRNGYTQDEVNMRQKRSIYFLVPIRGLRRAMAKASLRANWRLAETFRVNLSEEEIDREVGEARTILLRKKAK